ncbi:MAG TPA: hypothetical protein PL073_09510 [Spirochaetota bacterium]|jgi:hypothetical protein|nr:hypothetical protein [Spirochaetota bacterium]
MTFNDTKMYTYFAIAMFIVALLFGLPGLYSTFITEPAIESLIYQDNPSSQQLKQAYIMLRKPHIFAGYNRYDEVGAGIEYILKDFDLRVAEKKDFDAQDRMYLELLLERRKQGSDLSIKTMVFFVLLSLLGVIALVIEKRVNRDVK